MLLRDQRTRNVKLGTGGIREIELIAQSLQIRYGSQTVEIRQRNTLGGLAALCEQTFISREECDALTQAYVFLRDVENKLQMANDAQVHSLPQDETELTVVARTLGYTTADDFQREYQRFTSEVNQIFASYFSEPT